MYRNVDFLREHINLNFILRVKLSGRKTLRVLTERKSSMWKAYKARIECYVCDPVLCRKCTTISVFHAWLVHQKFQKYL